jgi:hypothetical protein
VSKRIFSINPKIFIILKKMLTVTHSIPDWVCDVYPHKNEANQKQQKISLCEMLRKKTGVPGGNYLSSVWPLHLLVAVATVCLCVPVMVQVGEERFRPGF